MSNTYLTVQNILRKELLVPIKKIKSKQKLTSDLGLSPFEMNVLFYFVEEKYHVSLPVTSIDFTVKELIYSIEHTPKL